MNAQRSILARPALLIASLLALAGCSTQNNNPFVSDPQQQFPLSTNPAATPAVLATYPPNGATGPFPGIYTASEGGPHFKIIFNKMMVPQTFTKHTVHVTGSDGIPISRVSAYTQDVVAGNTIPFQILGSLPYETSIYRVGVTYTVTIDTTVTDIYGMHPAAPITFSFTPEPYFRVTGILTFQPPNTGLIPSVHQPILAFNSPMSAKNLDPFIHFSPPLAGTWDHQPFLDTTEIVCHPDNVLDASTTYTITVDAGIHDADGNTLRAPYTTLPFTLTPFFPYSLMSVFPQPLTENALLFLHPVIEWPYVGDFSSFAVSGTISPPVGRGLFQTSFNPYQQFFAYADSSVDLAPNTHYTMSVQLNEVSYRFYLDSTEKNFTFDFTTGPFTVLSTAPPADAGLRQPRSTVVQISFTGNIDEPSARNAFSITPSAAGTLSFPVPPQYPVRTQYFSLPFASPRRNLIVFTPSSPLAANTMYTVRCDTSLHSIGGYPLNQVAEFQFTTGGQ